MPTVGDFVASSQTSQADNQFVPSGELRAPSITQDDPESYATLTARRAVQNLAVPTGEDYNKAHQDALARAQNFQADLAKSQAQKTFELQQRARAVAPSEGGGPSLLQTEKTQEAGVSEAAAERQKQWEQGPLATQEADALSQQYGRPVFIAKIPDEQRPQLAQIETAYQRLNNLQKLHQDMVNSAPGAGGVLRSTIGGFFTQPGLTNQAARNFLAYQDESLTPLATGIFGDKAASATKDKQVELMKGTLPTEADNLQQAGNKIFMMKNTLMERLRAMGRENLGTYSTGEINNLYHNLEPDFKSDPVQKLNPYNTPATSSVQVTNGSPESRAAIQNTLTQGLNMPQYAPNNPQAQLGQPGQTQQPAQTQTQQPGQVVQPVQEGYSRPGFGLYFGS